MTTLISILGIAGRFAGDLLTSALGWASSLLFGRVPRSHQVFLVLMMAASILWTVFLLALVLPSIGSFMLATTPHPPFVDQAWLGVVLLVGAITLPMAVGLAGFLVPAEGERPTGRAAVVEIARGYVLAPMITGLLVFLAGVGLVRKICSWRHHWSDVHVPIVAKARGYDRLVADLQGALSRVELPVAAEEAPWVLTVPGRLLGRVAGANVRRLHPDRLIELTAPDLRIGVYPSDIAISGSAKNGGRARAAVVSRLATSAAHLTTSAESQEVEDRLGEIAKSGRQANGDASAISARFEEIDATLLDLAVPPDEWDILYRVRLQIERDLLAGNQPGTASPGDEDPGAGSITRRARFRIVATSGVVPMTLPSVSTSRGGWVSTRTSRPWLGSRCRSRSRRDRVVGALPSPPAAPVPARTLER